MLIMTGRRHLALLRSHVWHVLRGFVISRVCLNVSTPSYRDLYVLQF